MEKIALSDVIVDLRRELLEAQKKAEEADLKFTVEDIDVEFQVATSTDVGGKGGVKFWVFNAEMAGKQTDQVVHKIRLRLKPVGELKISDQGKKPK